MKLNSKLRRKMRRANAVVLTTQVFKGSNSHGRRKYNRLNGIKANVISAPSFANGEEVKITVEDYGKSYCGSKGTIVGISGDSILVQLKKRKKPLAVQMTHAQKVG